MQETLTLQISVRFDRNRAEPEDILHAMNLVLAAGTLVHGQELAKHYGPIAAGSFEVEKPAEKFA